MNQKATTAVQKTVPTTSSPRKKLVAPHTQNNPTNKSKPVTQSPEKQPANSPKKLLNRNISTKISQISSLDVHSKSSTAKKEPGATHHKRSTSDAQLKLQLSKDKGSNVKAEKSPVTNSSSRFGQDKPENSKGISDPYHIYRKVLSEASPAAGTVTAKSSTSVAQTEFPDKNTSQKMGKIVLRMTDNSITSPSATTPLKDVFFSENKTRASVYQKRFDALKGQPSQNGAATPLTPKGKNQVQTDCTPRTPAKTFYKKDNPYHIPKINEKKFAQKVDEVSSTIRKIYRDHKRGLSVGQVYNFANEDDEIEGRKSTKEESIMLNKGNQQEEGMEKEDIKEEETINVPEKPTLPLGLENYRKFFEVGRKTFEFDSMFENQAEEKATEETNVKVNLIKSPGDMGDKKEKEEEGLLTPTCLTPCHEGENSELTLELSKCLQRSVTYDAYMLGQRADKRRQSKTGMDHLDLAQLLDLITNEEEEGVKGI